MDAPRPTLDRMATGRRVHLPIPGGRGITCAGPRAGNAARHPGHSNCSANERGLMTLVQYWLLGSPQPLAARTGQGYARLLALDTLTVIQGPGSVSWSVGAARGSSGGSSGSKTESALFGSKPSSVPGIL
jgi:hypothetical protein